MLGRNQSTAPTDSNALLFELFTSVFQATGSAFRSDPPWPPKDEGSTAISDVSGDGDYLSSVEQLGELT